jgi:hypothetical protein
MNIRTAAYAALCATIFSGPAQADLVFTTMVSPDIIQAGERTYVTLSISGDVFDPNFYFEGHYWEAMPWQNYVTFYDGLGGSTQFLTQTWDNISPAWGEIATYPDAGTFFPHFDADIILRLTRGYDGQCDTFGHSFCVALVNLGGDFATSVTVNAVPGPVIGAGLPGLLLSLLFWFTYRRRSNQLG